MPAPRSTFFGLLFSQPLLILFGVLITLSNNVLSYSCHSYQTELFPTRVRAHAVGFTYAFRRISTVFASFTIGFFFASFHGTVGVFALIAFAMLMVVLSHRHLWPKDAEPGAGGNLAPTSRPVRRCDAERIAERYPGPALPALGLRAASPANRVRSACFLVPRQGGKSAVR